MATCSQNGKKTSQQSVSNSRECCSKTHASQTRSAEIGNTLVRCIVFPFLLLIRVYRICISPLLGPKCRFHPTCSAYAEEALRVHGIAGLWMATKRIFRCHPWNPGGYDPVPEKQHHH